MSREAMTKALEALEGIHPGNMTPMAEEYWNKAITALKTALAEQALDRMAENARELGLDYEPAQPEPADDQLVWIVVAFIALMLTLLTLRSCL